MTKTAEKPYRTYLYIPYKGVPPPAPPPSPDPCAIFLKIKKRGLSTCGA